MVVNGTHEMMLVHIPMVHVYIVSGIFKCIADGINYGAGWFAGIFAELATLYSGACMSIPRCW